MPRPRHKAVSEQLQFGITAAHGKQKVGRHLIMSHIPAKALHITYTTCAVERVHKTPSLRRDSHSAATTSINQASNASTPTITTDVVLASRAVS